MSVKEFIKDRYGHVLEGCGNVSCKIDPPTSGQVLNGACHCADKPGYAQILLSVVNHLSKGYDAKYYQETAKPQIPTSR